MEDQEQRLVNLETIIADLEKTVDELNQVVVSHWKIIERLLDENKRLKDELKSINTNYIKSFDDETPPPHY